MRQATTTPALALALLIVGSSAMARDTDFQIESGVPRERTPLEEFMQTEHGRDMQRLLDLLKARDEEGFQREHEAYRKKYNAPPLGGWPKDTQQPAPRSAAPSRPPLVLTPEAR